MTEQWVRDRLAGTEPPPGAVDLDAVLARAHDERRLRGRRRRGAAGVGVAAVLAASAAVALPLGLRGGSRDGSPELSAGPPADTHADCASGESATGRAAGQDLAALATFDYREPASMRRSLDGTTGALASRSAAAQAASAANVESGQVVSTAVVQSVGYLGGGCDHPRYLVAFRQESHRRDATAPMVAPQLFAIRAVTRDGRVLLDEADAANGPSATLPSATTCGAAALGADLSTFLRGDYRAPAVSSRARLGVVSGGLAETVRAQAGEVADLAATQRLVTTAQAPLLAYVGGGCDHPRYLAVIGTSTSRDGAAATVGVERYLLRGAPRAGAWTLDELALVSA